MKLVPPYPKYPFFRWIPATPEQAAIDLSILAYSDKPFIESVLSGVPWVRKWNFVSRGVTQVLVVEIVKGSAFFDGPKFVAFRGTETFNVEDWITDLNCNVNEFGIHRGFHDAYMKVCEDIEDENGTCYTGHSLGAAIATIAAWRSYCRAHHPMLITFGSPRVGTEEFIRRMPSIGQARYVHGQDIVPHLPPGRTYVHLGCANLLEPMPKPLMNMLTPHSVFDHVPTLYAERIWQVDIRKRMLWH